MIYLLISLSIAVGIICSCFMAVMALEYAKRIKSSIISWRYLITDYEVWLFAILLIGFFTSAVAVWFFYTNIN